MKNFKFNDESVIVSLDIGTTSIRCAIIQKDTELPLELLGFSEKPCYGFNEGKVTDFNEVRDKLSEVMEEAEKQAQKSFTEAWLGFSTPFHSFSSRGMVALPTREVTLKDIDLALDTACAVPLPSNHVRIHSNPQSFYVDDQDSVLNPLGLSGLRLETQVHIVTVPEIYCQDMTKVLKSLGCFPKGFIHNLVAYGEHLLDSRQKSQGICICDIGHKSSRILVYKDMQVVDMFSLPFGGEVFHLALSSEFKISLDQAEELKKSYISFSGNSEEEQLELPNSGVFVSRKAFREVLERTLRPFFEGIKESLISKNLKTPAGIVWTGQTAYAEGFLDFAQFQTGLISSHPRNFISNDFKKTNTFAIAAEAYKNNRLFKQKKIFPVSWDKIKEFF